MPVYEVKNQWQERKTYKKACIYRKLYSKLQLGTSILSNNPLLIQYFENF